MLEADETSDDSVSIAPAEVPGYQSLSSLAYGVVIIAALYIGREVLIPIALAILLSFLLAPLVRLLRRIHLGRGLSVLLAVLLAFGIILAIGGAIGTQLAGLGRDAPYYEATIASKTQTLSKQSIQRLGNALQNMGKPFQVAHNAPKAAPPTATGAPAAIPVVVQQPSPTPISIAEKLAASMAAPLATASIVIIVTIFILLQQEDLRDRLIRLFGSNDLHGTTLAMDDAADRLSRYFIAKLAINVAFGVIIGVGLFFIGVPSPVLWGVLAMLMRFIPYIGPWISAAPPILLAAAVGPSWAPALWTAGLFVFTEGIVGQAVEPLIYGHHTGLSPVAVVIAAIFWGWLWGPIGLILSTPLTLCLVVLGRHVKRLEFLDVLFGDQPALTPVQTFYQRMLAGDTTELVEQAEALLDETSLSAYYDKVALEGLRLASNDVLRGAIVPERLSRLRQVMLDVIEDLDDHEDADPVSKEDEKPVPEELTPAEQGLKDAAVPPPVAPARIARNPGFEAEAPVLCVAGRGPFDHSVAEMFAQLLAKHGLGARIAKSDALSRARLGALNVAGVGMVCFISLDPAAPSSGMRYLLRRVQQRVQGIPMVAGLGPADAVLGTIHQHGITVQGHAESLREMIEICLTHAIAPAPVQADSAAPREPDQSLPLGAQPLAV
jgi:predicted PurR-regulated permease PerM